jgi:hypothetical protein
MTTITEQDWITSSRTRHQFLGDYIADYFATQDMVAQTKASVAHIMELVRNLPPPKPKSRISPDLWAEWQLHLAARQAQGHELGRRRSWRSSL